MSSPTVTPALPPALDAANGQTSIVPSVPLGGLSETGCTRLISTGLAEEVSTAVRRTNYPAHCQEFLEALQGRAMAEVAAATPAPLDDTVLTDRLAIEALGPLAERRAAAEARLEQTTAKLSKAKKRLTKLVPPWSAFGHAAVLVLGVAVIVVGIAAVSGLFTPHIDLYVLNGYAARLAGDENPQYSAKLASILSVLCAATLLLGPAYVVFISAGRISNLIKIATLSGDLLFSIAFALIRLRGPVTWVLVAMSALEVALFLALNAVLLGLAGALRRNVERAEVWGVAKGLVALAEERLAAAGTALATTEELLTRQLQALEQRIALARRLSVNQALAKETAATEYYIALAQLISESVAHTGSAALLSMVDKHLANELQRAPAENLRPRGSHE